MKNYVQFSEISKRELGGFVTDAKLQLGDVVAIGGEQFALAREGEAGMKKMPDGKYLPARYFGTVRLSARYTADGETIQPDAQVAR